MKRSFFITSLNYFKRFVKNFFLKAIAKKGSAAYWSNHMVANENWSDSEQSIEYFHWRNEQYPGYIDLMPTSHADGLIVADYGCGPGNDLVGFHEFSKPAKLIGIDVSEKISENQTEIKSDIAENKSKKDIETKTNLKSKEEFKKEKK